MVGTTTRVDDSEGIPLEKSIRGSGWGVHETGDKEIDQCYGERAYRKKRENAGNPQKRAVHAMKAGPGDYAGGEGEYKKENRAQIDRQGNRRPMLLTASTKDALTRTRASSCASPRR